MFPFDLTPERVADLWSRHGIRPLIGDLFGWEDDQADGDRPRGANIIGVLMVDRLGWDVALRLYRGEDVLEIWENVHDPSGAVVGRVDIGIGVAVAEALQTSYAFVHWATCGWDWTLRGTDRECEIPRHCVDPVARHAYQLGIMTRRRMEVAYPAIDRIIEEQ